MTKPLYKPSNIRTVFHLRHKVPHLSQDPDGLTAWDLPNSPIRTKLLTDSGPEDSAEATARH